MCDPVTVAAVAGATAIIMQGYAAKQQGDYASDISKYNARLAENEAVQVRNVGTEAENIQRQRTAQLVSQQRAQLGAANVDIGSGSAASLLQDTATLGEADALRIKTNYAFQARSLEDKASLTLAEGAAKKQAGNMAFAGSLLSGGAAFVAAPGVSSKWFTPDSIALTQSASPIVDIRPR